MSTFKTLFVFISLLIALLLVLSKAIDSDWDSEDCEPVKFLSIDMISQFLVLERTNGEEIKKDYSKKDIKDIERYINKRPRSGDPYIFICGYPSRFAKIIWPDSPVLKL